MRGITNARPLLALAILALVGCGETLRPSPTEPASAFFGKSANDAIAQSLVAEIEADIDCLYAAEETERLGKRSELGSLVRLHNTTTQQAEAVRARVNNFVRDTERYLARTSGSGCGGKSAAIVAQELFNRLHLLSGELDKIEMPAYGSDASLVVCLPAADCARQTPGGAAISVPAGSFDVPVIITIAKGDSFGFDYSAFNAVGAPVASPYHFDVTPAITANGGGWARYICVPEEEHDNGVLQLFRRNATGLAQPIASDPSPVPCLLPAHRAVGGYDVLASPHVAVRVAGTADVSTFCPGGPVGSYSDLQAAVDNTADGGTVEVCDGEFTADSVIIDKPLTVRSENAGQATLVDEGGNVCCQGGVHPVFIVKGVSSGLVRFASINFEVTGGAILAGGPLAGTPEPWDQIEVDSVGFVGRDTLRSYPIRTFASSVAGARLEVRNSSFRGVQIAVFVLSGEVNVRSSRFAETNRGVVYSFASTNPTAAASGTAENNMFDACGWGGCIRVLGRGGVLLKGNTIQVDTGIVGRGFTGAIYIGPLAQAPGLPVVVEDNVIIGARVAANPPDSTGWTIRNGVVVVDTLTGGPVVTVRRNTISNAYTGVVMWVKIGLTVEAHDNTISDGAYGLRHRGGGIGRFRRNDVVNTFGSVLWDFPLGGSRDYTCNWWGSASGPANVPGQLSPSVYTPWATQPIANKPEVSCN